MININISRTHLIILLVIVVAATIINYTIAQGGTQSHPISQIEGLDDGTCTDGTSGNSRVDCADYAYDGPFADKVSFIMVTNAGPGSKDNCDQKCSDLGYNCAFSYYDDGGEYMMRIDDCTNTIYGTKPNRCACWP